MAENVRKKLVAPGESITDFFRAEDEGVKSKPTCRIGEDSSNSSPSINEAVSGPLYDE